MPVGTLVTRPPTVRETESRRCSRRPPLEADADDDRSRDDEHARTACPTQRRVQPAKFPFGVKVTVDPFSTVIVQEPFLQSLVPVDVEIVTVPELVLPDLRAGDRVLHRHRRRARVDRRVPGDHDHLSRSRQHERHARVRCSSPSSRQRRADARDSGERNARLAGEHSQAGVAAIDRSGEVCPTTPPFPERVTTKLIPEGIVGLPGLNAASTATARPRNIASRAVPTQAPPQASSRSQSWTAVSATDDPATTFSFQTPRQTGQPATIPTAPVVETVTTTVAARRPATETRPAKQTAPTPPSRCLTATLATCQATSPVPRGIPQKRHRTPPGPLSTPRPAG